jgi:DNA-binding NtrC family response regulator
LGNVRGASDPKSSGPAILSISYDEPLLQTREWILKAEGYDVTSAAGFTEGVRHCGDKAFDLVIIGHSIPRTDKLALIAEFRKYGKAPVLSILRHGEGPLAEANYWVDSADGPEALVRMVKKALDGT